MERDLTTVDHASSLSRRFPIITAIITFLVERSNGTEGFPALITPTLTNAPTPDLCQGRRISSIFALDTSILVEKVIGR